MEIHAFGLPLSATTLTPLSELTLRILWLSSANSRLSNNASVSPVSRVSGLSPSSLVNSGFRNAFLNASAMIAASEPVMTPSGLAEPEFAREFIESSLYRTDGAVRTGGGTVVMIVAPCPIEVLVAAPGDKGAPGACIIGDSEPIEVLRFNERLLLAPRRRTKDRVKMETIEITPSMTMSAIAQAGKKLLFCPACNAASRDDWAACADEDSSAAMELEAEARDCDIREALADDSAELGSAVCTTTNVG